ncbi:MAG: ABC transporter substrate-binding protein [Thermomicrobiales bacterium]
MSDDGYIAVDEQLERKLTRRSTLKFMGFAVAVPVVSSILAACGGSDDDDDDDGGDTSSPTTDSSTPLANAPVTSGGTPLTTFGTAAANASPTAAATEGSTGSGSTDDDAKRGGVLLLASSIDPDALDPAGTIQLAADALNDSLYDRLVYIGRDRMPHPWVAENWEVSEDGTEITFSIREGMTFHDGGTLDAASVKFSFDRILDPEKTSPAKAQMGTLEKVDLVDDSTVMFTFTEAYAPFFTNISLGYGGIVSPAAVEEHGDAFGKNPVGSGPFKLKEWNTGQEIVLERFDEYVNHRTDGPNTGTAYLDEISFQIISEAATRFAALESGELHVSDVDVNQIPNVEGSDDFQVVIWKEATNHNFLEYANKAPFTDVAVRQAIAYSIDRESIVESAWNGYATPNLNPMPVGVAGWDAAIGEEFGYAFDVERAAQVLADAGYTAGSDNVLEKDGTPLAFTLLVYSGAEPARVASEIIQATLNSIGFKVEIQIMEFGAELPLLEAGDFDVDWMRWTWPDPVILSLLFKTPGWTNQTSDPALDELLSVADTALDPDARIAATHEALKYILQQAIIAPIATDFIVRAARKEVKGYEWDAIGYPRYGNVWLEES